MQIAWLAEVYALDGRLDDASERAREALSLAHAHEERGHEAFVQHLLGEIGSHRGTAPETRAAEDHYRHALALVTEFGMRPLIVHCRLGLGTLCATDAPAGTSRLASISGLPRQCMPTWPWCHGSSRRKPRCGRLPEPR